MLKKMQFINVIFTGKQKYYTKIRHLERIIALYAKCMAVYSIYSKLFRDKQLSFCILRLYQTYTRPQ